MSAIGAEKQAVEAAPLPGEDEVQSSAPTTPLGERLLRIVIPVGMLVLLYVCARVGTDVAGAGGAVATIAAFLALEAVLFRTTRNLEA
mgnify:CR=1 FL=1